ncbi:MAG: RDD family protein [Dehalococcoidia bacterium]|nr:RDD family protein [Dehalococcoidia bacterium]
MSFDSPIAGPGPRWTGDRSLRPRVPLPEDDQASPAHRSFRNASPVPFGRRTVEIGGVTTALATPRRRLAGLFIDLVLRTILLQLLRSALGVTSNEITIVAILAAQVWAIGWGTVFFTCGWTPGSLVVGVRIVRLVDGSMPGLRWGFVRAAGAVISDAVVLLGYLWALWDPRHQTWHDRFAGTVVIEVPREGRD